MEEFQVRLEQIGGCGDGGCMIHVRPGMHTNGGCRCSADPLKMRQTIHVYKGAVAAQAQENERLRKVMRLLKEDARERHEDWIEYGCDQKDAIRFVGDVCGILRAALQPKEGV